MPERHVPIPAIALDKWLGMVDLVAEISAAPAVTIMQFEGGKIRVLSSSQGPGNPIKAGAELDCSGEGKLYCQAVAETRGAVLIPNAPEDPDWRGSASVKTGFIAYLGVPVFYPDGDLFGTVCIFDTRPNRFSATIVRLLERFADMITMHLSLIEQNLTLENALKEIGTLQGLIPICAKCKKIRNDKGFWEKVETYIEKHSAARFSHGMCEACAQEMYGKQKWFKEFKSEKK